MMYELPPAMRAVLHTTDENTTAALRSEYRAPRRAGEEMPETPRHRLARRRTAALRQDREFRIFNVDIGALLKPFTRSL